MSYLGFEISRWLGKPVECFRFTCGSAAYLYTSASSNVVLNSETYVATPITRGKFEVSQDALKSDLDIKVPRTGNYLAPLFIGQPPEDLVKVVIYRIHKGDSEAIVYWKGRVTSCSITEDEATLKCESYFTSLKQSGLRAKYQQLCRHMLYGSQCGISNANYALRLEGVANSQRTLTHASLASQADGWWNGGYAELDTGEKRMIVAHSGSTVTVNYAYNSILSAVTFYPGCNLLVTTCQYKFNNILNFGGFPYISTNNPFSGDKIM